MHVRMRRRYSSGVTGDESSVLFGSLYHLALPTNVCIHIYIYGVDDYGDFSSAYTERKETTFAIGGRIYMITIPLENGSLELNKNTKNKIEI